VKTSEVISLYISHKRALGRRYRGEEAILRSFCKMTENQPITAIRAETVLAFLNGKGEPITETWLKKYRVLSGLYKFALIREWVMVSPLPHTQPKPISTFVPYIYSHEELRRLLDTVPDACGDRSPVDEKVFRIFFLLLYGTGLRMGEALALTLNDVDLSQAFLYIRNTKFFKSRLVPLGKDLTKVLTEYVLNLNHGGNVEAPFFCFHDGSPMSQTAARNVFRRMRTYAGVHCEGGPRHQPRLHDLRHSFAVHRLISWYRSGEDLHTLLPKLATYLGHVDLSSTQRYLTLTPELLQQASLRFEHYARGEQS